MRRTRHRRRGGYVAAAAMAWIATANAVIQAEQQQIALPEQTSCGAGQRLQLTLGLPTDYPQPAPSGRPLVGFDQVCVSTASGSPYQLLSWLENDHLQVVVLPEFAVAVLARDNPRTFASNYLVLERSPLQLLTLRQSRLELAALHGSARGAAAFVQVFARAQGQSAAPRVVLPHHLSAAMDHFLSRATAHADQAGLTGNKRARFFTRLIAGLTFRQPLRDASVDGDFEYVPVASIGAPETAFESLDRDVLVVHRNVVSSYPQLQRTIASVPEAAAPAVAGQFAWLGTPGEARDPVLAAFYTDNYALHQYGSISRRYFRFTIPELWALLADGVPAEPPPEDSGGLALVLTGGGVKAAYQTRLVERLYQSGRLRNSAATAPAVAQGTQQVDYVIGTSGGALLGIFVAALDAQVTQQLAQAGDASLTSILWGEAGKRLRSRDIFPLQDMMRYGSIVACFVLLLMVGSIAVRFAGKRFEQVSTLTGQPRGQAPRARPDVKRWLTESPPWIALLLFAPVFIVTVASRRGLEHMPAISGVLYLLMALIALDADQRFTPTNQSFNWLKVRPSIISLVLAGAGLLAILVSLRFAWRDSAGIPGCDDWSPAVALCSAGFLLLALALHRLFAHQKTFLSAASPAPFMRALLLVLGIVLASHLVLLAVISLGKAAILELSGSFWVWTLGATFVLACALMVLAALRQEDQPRFPAAYHAVGFLFSEHPSRAWLLGHRRLTRLVLLAVGSWLWWNLVAAPALYGNCNAREYFERTYQKFAQQAGRAVDPLPLSVPFVVTATSLQKSQERYFLFPPVGRAEHSGIQSDVWFRLVSDPRWLVVRDFKNQDLRSVAFASGSPFPVFAAHGVAIQSLDLDERFIDGGFAHNRPLDAARALGARRVLVLNSSPLPEHVPAGGCTLLRIPIGELACNLPRLVPYLWERSQTEDDLSSMTMLVASIYPTAAADWPMLTDFRGAVVDRLVAVADADTTRRVGVVESWGAPRFTDARLATINLSAVQRMLRQKR